MESAGKVELVVERTGNTTVESYVKYESIDGTATGGEDYEKVCGFKHELALKLNRFKGQWRSQLFTR